MAKGKQRTKEENERLKELAKLLYTVEGVTVQKELAERVGVSAQSINKWVNEDNWEMLRASIPMSREQELRRLYRRLTFLNDTVEALENAYSDKANLLSVTVDKKEKAGIELEKRSLVDQMAKLYDSMSKAAASIRAMETDVSIAETIEVTKGLIQSVRMADFDLAQKLTPLADEFIKEKLK